MKVGFYPLEHALTKMRNIGHGNDYHFGLRQDVAHVVRGLVDLCFGELALHNLPAQNVLDLHVNLIALRCGFKTERDAAIANLDDVRPEKRIVLAEFQVDSQRQTYMPPPIITTSSIIQYSIRDSTRCLISRRQNQAEGIR